VARVILVCLSFALTLPMALEGSVQDTGYRIGPNDVLSVAVLQAPELNTSARVSELGEISLPLVGTIRTTGLTTLQLELVIEARLREKYIREPEVSVQLTDLQSQPVSVLGAVRRPGVFQLRSTQTLLEVLSLAGGLADDAGDGVMVLRKGAAREHGREAGPATLEVNLKTLMESRDAHVNVPIYPGDVVTVKSAAIVYVVGAIKKPGAFAMRGNDRLTVLRALALGEGVSPTAARGDAVVLRTNDRGERVEIAVNLDAILKGKAPDVTLDAQDVLFVPTSGGKVVARAAIDTLTRVLTLRVIP